MHTLNDAALEGESPFACYALGNCECRIECDTCPVKSECDASLNGEVGEIIRTFHGWLAWLCDDVKGEKISSGYRVLYTSRINQYHIARPDGTNLYAKGRPLVLLPVDLKRYKEFVVYDVFSSRYGAACILVEDTKTGEMRFYSDILS